MRQRLEVRQVGTLQVGLAAAGYGDATARNLLEQGAPKAAEVTVLGIVDLRNAPRVDSSTDRLAIHLNFLLGANDRERHHGLLQSGKLNKGLKRMHSVLTRSSLLSWIVSSSSSSMSYGKL